MTLQMPAVKLSEWADMEDSNAHGERLESIAEWCCRCAGPNHWGGDFLDVFTLLRCINSIHGTHFGLPMWLYEIREQARRQLRALVLEAYGAEALEKVNP